MARTLSSTMTEQLYRPQTSACYVVLLEFYSDELSESIYLVNNNEAVTHNSQEYTPYNFNFTLPDEDESQALETSITVENIDRRLTIALRSVREPINVRARVVEVSTPDTTEVGPFEFVLRDVRYNATTVTGNLQYLNYVEKYAATLSYTNLEFPGLYD